MKKDKKEAKKLRVLGRLMADEIPKEVLDQARGGILKATGTLGVGETKDFGP